MATHGNCPHRIRKFLIIDILKGIGHRLCNRVWRWRCMVNCVKGPCRVREGLRIEIFQAAFAIQIDGTGDARPAVQKATLRSRALERYNLSIDYSLLSCSINNHWRCMANCGKGPTAVARASDLESFKRPFPSLRSPPPLQVHQRALAMRMPLLCCKASSIGVVACACQMQGLLA